MTGGTAQQREQADEARARKLDALHRSLTEQVTALANGPQWQAWLDVAAKFHQYSFNNTVLLMAQKPDATQVAGYNLWKELGRQVLKGEKGLSVLAPVTRKRDDEEAATLSPLAIPPRSPVAADVKTPAATPQRVVVGFRPAYVWDISQTSGDPIPQQPRPQLLAGEAPAGLWDALAAQCAAAGFTVDRRHIGGDAGPNGYTAYATHEVVVRSDVDDAQAVKTLAHELGHVLMHDPAGFDRGLTSGCRGAREVEAESVAYLVAAEHGLDTSGYTFAYVAGWAAQTGDLPTALAASGARVLTAAHHILEQTTSTPPPARPQPDQSVLVSVAADHATIPGISTTEPVSAPGRDRLVDANRAAADYFATAYRSSWAAAYLEQRLGTDLLGRGDTVVGYAPPGWADLTDHLRSARFSDEEILAAGLGTIASTGRVIDRFRDRLMFPITGTGENGPEIIGFVGRRNPAHDSEAASWNPKYLNTGQTPLYTKGDHLYGLADSAEVLRRGGLAVLVEGPVDRWAVDLASGGMMAGVATLGTALTDRQATLLRAALGSGSDRIVVATDADPAGEKAAAHAYDLLTGRGLDPRGATLPTGLDPAKTLEVHGPAALVGPLADAQPLVRRVIHHALADRELVWPEQRVAAARYAGGLIAKAPAQTWPREITAIATETSLPSEVLHIGVIDAITPEPDGLVHGATRSGRIDRDHADNVRSTAADIAGLSTTSATTIQPSTHSTEQPRPSTAPSWSLTAGLH